MTPIHPPGADRADSGGSLRAKRIRRALPLPLHDGDPDGAAASAALARGRAEASGTLGRLAAEVFGTPEPATAVRPLPATASQGFRPGTGRFGTDEPGAATRSGKGKTGPWPLVAAAAVAGAVLVTAPLLHHKNDREATDLEGLDRPVPVATLGADSDGHTSQVAPDGSAGSKSDFTDGTVTEGIAPSTGVPRTGRPAPAADRPHTGAAPTTATPPSRRTPPHGMPETRTMDAPTYAAPEDREMAPHNFSATLSAPVVKPVTRHVAQSLLKPAVDAVVRPAATPAKTPAPSIKPLAAKPTPEAKSVVALATYPKPAAQQYGTRVVDATSVLHAGQSVSTDHIRVAMTQGGNLEIGDPSDGTVLWSAHTSGSGNYAVFQADGNLVVYSADGLALWTSGSAGHDGARMVLQDDGNVVICSTAGNAVWSSGTVH